MQIVSLLIDGSTSVIVKFPQCHLTNQKLSATYDFSIPKSDFSPYLGIGTYTQSGFYGELGVDYNFSENIVVNANYKFRELGNIQITGGYRF